MKQKNKSPYWKNMLTLNDLRERIANNCDEISILEILNINSFDLVERFGDRIEERYDALVEDFEEDTDGD